jgi:predicted glycogen debranching enzyme
MPLYHIDTNGELRRGLEREWLLTNGWGGFASSTLIGCNTRRYHGMLVAATKPPVGRVMAVNRVGEVIQRPNQATLELSVNQFTDRFHPRGEQYLRSFELGDTARWHYEAEGIQVTKELLLLWKRNAMALRYTIVPAHFKPLTFSLLPFLSMRDFHALRAAQTARFEVKHHRQSVTVRSGANGGAMAVHIRCDRGQFQPQQDWWFGHLYAIEAERGQDFQEDLYTPGRFSLEVVAPTTMTLLAGADPESEEELEQIDFDAEVRRRAGARKPPPANTPAVVRLSRAADDFIVARRRPDGAEGQTVIAGYPWFADWGRDTMIALPGLFLTTGRFEEAGRVLSTFAQYVSEGMIPNRFDDYTSEPHYNTVDASLWFIHAAHEYARLSKDTATFEQTLKPACRKIVDGYRRGTRFGIRVDDRDGLVTQGNATTQLTWMDAKCGEVCFTPRQGKAVEINALWYNALALLGERDEAVRVAESFRKVFWISPFRGLADVVDDNGKRDQSIRPNQIFAASLPHSALTREQQSAVVEVVRRELLTPVGLRTLDPAAPGFCPTYRGDQLARDRAYHNGTIWPWLIGAFLEAHLRVHDNSAPAREQARQWLRPLVEHVESGGCVGSISEIFEAQAPHRPVGCFAQAWSVSEVLRLTVMLEM